MTTPIQRSPREMVRKTVTHKQLREYLLIAIEQGWTPKLSRKGHIKMLSPDGKTTVGCPGTPSCYRGVKNVRADLRRAGVKFP